jgi:hypothetical protein
VGAEGLACCGESRGRTALPFRWVAFHFDRVAGRAWEAGWAADAVSPIRHPIWRFRGKSHYMVTIILFASGLICFALFFKSIDYFEKI